MNFVLELPWPVQVVAVFLDKHDFSFEDAHLIDCFAMIFLQIDNLVIEKFIVLMSFDYAYILILFYRQELVSFGFYQFLNLLHCPFPAN
jgi:hypothetical protein